MKQKINLRLIGIAILAVFATAFSLIFVYYGLFQRQVRDDLRMQALLLEQTGFFDVDDVETSVELLTEHYTDQDEILRFTWIDENGDVLFDNDADATELPNHADRPEVQDAIEEGSGESVRNSDTMHMNTFYYALLLDNRTVLRVSTEARSVFSVTVTMLPFLVLVLAIVITICVILANYLTRQLVKPIEEMAENMEDVSNVHVYKELLPFMNMIRSQHENILAAAMSRQDFTANVSHELKTPLTAISGYAELIENGMATQERQVYFAAEIRRNAERLLSLINDIIKLSELDSKDSASMDQYEDVDLYALAENCMGNLLVQASKRNIELNLEGESCIVRGNRDMLDELIENLCQNAIRYNNTGGYVKVTVTEEHASPTLIVEDNGIGIPKEDQERVFERFYRVDKSRSKQTGGTGLGLAIVKHIVALHHATITLESEVGVGTKITVRF